MKQFIFKGEDLGGHVWLGIKPFDPDVIQAFLLHLDTRLYNCQNSPQKSLSVNEITAVINDNLQVDSILEITNS